MPLEVALEPGEADVQVAAKAGRQHSRISLCNASTAPFVCGRPGADQGVAEAELVEGEAEVAGAKLAVVVGERALQAPAWPAARARPGERAWRSVCAPVRLPCGQLTSSAQA